MITQKQLGQYFHIFKRENKSTFLGLDSLHESGVYNPRKHICALDILGGGKFRVKVHEYSGQSQDDFVSTGDIETLLSDIERYTKNCKYNPEFLEFGLKEGSIENRIFRDFVTKFGWEFKYESIVKETVSVYGENSKKIITWHNAIFEYNCNKSKKSRLLYWTGEAQWTDVDFEPTLGATINAFIGLVSPVAVVDLFQQYEYLKKIMDGVSKVNPILDLKRNIVDQNFNQHIFPIKEHLKQSLKKMLDVLESDENN